MSNKLFAYKVYKRSYALTQKTTFQKSSNLFIFIKLGIVGTVKFDRALKHWRISARMGEESSLKNILELHKMGHATRDDYAQALRAYMKAKDEMSTNERDEAKKYWGSR